jgi:4-amino-4-deoxy-L-arabinose transferase-like glycosyltransferase
VLARFGPPAAVIVGVAVLLYAVYDPWYLNYDARYALLWARDIAHGFTPDFEAGFASTPHPLSIAWSFLALPFGHGGDQVIVWLELLGFGAVVWLVYRIGAVVFSPWAGAAAALAVLTRPVLEREVVTGYQDVLFAAFILGAVLLEARAARRGTPVLVLLALAGLIRPEAWLLAGMYVLYLWRAQDVTRREQVRVALLGAAAPLLWLLMDVVVTGDPLHSLHTTSTVAEQSNLRHGVSQVPEWTVRFFAYTLREPVVVGLPVGLFFAWRHRRTRAAWLLVVVAGAMTAVFAIGPVFGQPILARFIRTPAMLLTVFFGAALFGWLMLDRGDVRERRLWAAAALVVAIVTLVFAPSTARQLDGLRTRADSEGKLYGDLRELGESPVVRRAFRACGPLSVADHRPIPFIRWWIDGDPGSVGTPYLGSRPLGKLLLAPRHTRPPSRFYAGRFPKATAPPGWRTVFENRSWRVSAAPSCPARA